MSFRRGEKNKNNERNTEGKHINDVISELILSQSERTRGKLLVDEGDQ